MLRRLSTSRSAGWLAAALVIVVWGVTFAVTRALLEDFSSLEINLARFTLAWVALAIMPIARRKLLPDGDLRTSNPVSLATCSARREEILFAAMGLTGVALCQFLENCAIYYTNASNVAILVSFGPIVTAVLARIFSHDRSLSPKLVGGSLVAVCGVALVALNGVFNFQLRPIGDLMALGAMLSWGVYSVLVDKVNERGISPAYAVRRSFGWALAMMVLLAAWGATEGGYVALDGSYSVTLELAANIERFSSVRNLSNIAFLGLLASALCFGLWSFACRALGMVRVTVGLYLIPIVGVVFAVAFLGERLTAMSVGGGVLILIGVAIANLKKGVGK